MKEKEKKQLIVAICLVTIFVLVFALGNLVINSTLVKADDVMSGNEGPTNATINVTSSVPVITFVHTHAAVTLTGNASVTHYFSFNVTDENGAGDINITTANVTINGTHQSSTCVNTTSSGNEMTINCTLSLPFWVDAGAVVINASVQDNAEQTARNDTETVTINALDYMIQDRISLYWTSGESPGNGDYEADNPLTFYNGGNQDYTYVNITSSNATLIGGSDVINDEDFMVDVDTGQTTGQLVLNDTVAKWSDFGSVHGAESSEQAFVYVNLPSGISQGTYNSTANWNWIIA